MKMIRFGVTVTAATILALAPLSAALAEEGEEGDEEQVEETIETIEGVVEVEEFEDEDGIYEMVSVRTDDDTVYEVDDKSAIELSEKAGKRVQITGTTVEDDEVMSIFVSELKFLD